MIELTLSESLLIIDALNGSILQPELAEQLLPLEIEDAIKLDGLDSKWGVDGPALTAKLSGLTNAEANAIIEKTKQFWSDQYQVTDARARVLEIGMVTEEVVTPTQASKLSGKSASALSQLADRGKLVRYQDPAEPNPQRRTRYLKREVVALKKSSRKKAAKKK